MRTATAAVMLGVVLLGAGLSSCADDDGPPVSPAPQPSGTPVFASDEEALAAAVEAYGRYLDVSNAVGEGGWTEVDRLADVTRGEALAEELDVIDSYRERGLAQVGQTTFDSVVLQHYRAANPGEVEIAVYLCADVTGVDLIDATGASVVPPDRPDRQSLEVVLDDVESILKVSRSEAWSGESFC